jgi:hypothetical protein
VRTCRSHKLQARVEPGVTLPHLFVRLSGTATCGIRPYRKHAALVLLPLPGLLHHVHEADAGPHERQEMRAVDLTPTGFAPCRRSS